MTRTKSPWGNLRPAQWAPHDRVICNGHPGEISEICGGALAGMAVVWVPGGRVCVALSELRPAAKDTTP